MSDAGEWTPARSVAGDLNPWAIVAVISIATFMTVLDASIANVALAHIAGGLSASYDEATWVITSFLIANAIIIPISGWLSTVVGRKRFYMFSVALFTGASVLCGLAPNLTWLIIARILQGIGGGGLAPTEQSMLVDTFPPKSRGAAFAAYGMVVIVGPVVGPVLGGVITDTYSWHWVFLINAPIGVLSLILVSLFVHEPEALIRDRERLLANGLHVDIVGFILVGLALGCLEFTLDRGQRDDWFSSPAITGSAVVSAIAFIAFVPWELARRDPIVPIRMFARRNFAIASIFLLAVGMIIFGTTQFIPQLLQQVLGYTATDAGLALTAGGFATVLVMPFAGLLTGRLDARIMIGLAFVIEALALWNMSHLSTDMSFADAATARMWQAVGIPFLFVPISAIAYVGLRPEESNQASALMNVARNLGGTFGISLVQTMLAQRAQYHQARLAETLSPLNPVYANGTGNVAQSLVAHGQSALAASAEATAQLYQALGRQAQMLSYVEVFHTLAIIIALLAPLIFLLRGAQARGGGGGMG
ncbi:MAG TPA: DHA2 family efflux MFS transporter permease subunit [Caulobacteraceae bacterium]|jgi:DHA2 family multidrug resistance protein|nr:DHA2 family efflux MFS transporter permease subunit [Caulobacteraceae bacterium]